MKTNHWVLFGVMAAVGAVGGLLTLFAVKPEENKTDNPTERKFKPSPGMAVKRAKAR